MSGSFSVKSRSRENQECHCTSEMGAEWSHYRAMFILKPDDAFVFQKSTSAGEENVVHLWITAEQKTIIRSHSSSFQCYPKSRIARINHLSNKQQYKIPPHLAQNHRL